MKKYIKEFVKILNKKIIIGVITLLFSLIILLKFIQSIQVEKFFFNFFNLNKFGIVERKEIVNQENIDIIKQGLLFEIIKNTGKEEINFLDLINSFNKKKNIYDNYLIKDKTYNEFLQGIDNFIFLNKLGLLNFNKPIKVHYVYSYNIDGYKIVFKYNDGNFYIFKFIGENKYYISNVNIKIIGNKIYLYSDEKNITNKHIGNIVNNTFKPINKNINQFEKTLYEKTVFLYVNQSRYLIKPNSFLIEF